MYRLSTAMISCYLLLGLAACGQGDDASSGLIDSTMKNISRASLPGADITRRECGSCHYLDKNMRKVGPSLKGIMGKKPVTRGMPVEQWDEHTMDAWIENPTAVHPETRMKIPGIKDAEKRAIIIEYLNQL